MTTKKEAREVYIPTEDRKLRLIHTCGRKFLRKYYDKLADETVDRKDLVSEVQIMEGYTLMSCKVRVSAGRRLIREFGLTLEDL